MNGRSTQGQDRPIGQDLAHDEIGQIDRRRPHQDGEQTHDVNRQYRPPPRERFQRGVVDDQIDVAVGGSARVHVGVEVADGLHIGRINPTGRQRAEKVVERRLAALLSPGGLDAWFLHR